MTTLLAKYKNRNGVLLLFSAEAERGLFIDVESGGITLCISTGKIKGVLVDKEEVEFIF